MYNKLVYTPKERAELAEKMLKHILALGGTFQYDSIYASAFYAADKFIEAANRGAIDTERRDAE